jgi:hypothetical protein
MPSHGSGHWFDPSTAHHSKSSLYATAEFSAGKFFDLPYQLPYGARRQTSMDAGGCPSPLATSSRLFAATPATLERTLYALEADLL